MNTEADHVTTSASIETLSDLVAVSEHGGVLELRFMRPEVMNALTPAMLDFCCTVAEQVAARDDVRVLVLTGEGRAFCAGVDLREMSRPEITREQRARFNDQARRFIRLLETMRPVSIARVNGYCFTGGLELALGCDFIVAADEAVFSDTHAKLGLRPSWGGSQRLPRRIGAVRAREMSFTARRVSGQEARAIGLALDSVPLAELDRRVEDLIAAITTNSAGSIAAYKDLLLAGQDLPLVDALRYEEVTRYQIPDRKERARL